MARLSDKVVLVTGGASGIGAATARKVVAEGGRVVIADISPDAGKRLADELGEAALFIELDVTDPEAWTAAVDGAVRHFGALHGLVNNAGIMIPGSVEDVDPADWHRLIDVHLNGAFHGCRTAFPALKASGAGAIVNTSSNSVLQGYERYLAYTAAKSGVLSLTRSIAAYCRNNGIPVRCNTVLPGGIDTPLAREGMKRDLGIDPESDHPMAKAFLSAMGSPEQLANVVAFLLSDEASLVNGEEILVDGAMTRTVPPVG